MRGTDEAQCLYVLPSLPPLRATADSAVWDRNPEAETSERRERDSFLQQVSHSPSQYRAQVSRRKILPFRRWSAYSNSRAILRSIDSALTVLLVLLTTQQSELSCSLHFSDGKVEPWGISLGPGSLSHCQHVAGPG